MMRRIRYLRRSVFLCLALALTGACSTLNSRTPSSDTPLYIPPSPQSQESSLQNPSPTSQAAPTPTVECVSSLRFIADKTIPDGSILKPAEVFDKVWEVENNGSCNWDEHYRLKLIGGTELGANPEQALYPARSGVPLLIRIRFTAPEQPGNYRSAWQAFDPQGNPFGDPVYLEIIVQ